jgi:hypothetical protein
MTLVDFQAESLYGACQRLTPINPDYANLPIEEGFNWSPCLQNAYFDRLYVVVFRSVRGATADLDLLREYDDRAFADADPLVANGWIYEYNPDDALTESAGTR